MGPTGSPIEHLMKIRRFDGGVEEFFSKVDEVSQFKVKTFFPLAYMRHGHGVIECPTVVTLEAASYLKKVGQEMKAGLGIAMDVICNQYRSREEQTGLHASDVSRPAGMARDVAVAIPMSADSFIFIDRVAARNGTGKFAETVSLIIENVQSFRR